MFSFFSFVAFQDIGGPDEGMSMKQQGDLIFEILDKKPAFWAAPISLFDAIIGGLAFFGKWFDGAEDAAELARIGTYCTYIYFYTYSACLLIRKG